MKAHTFLIGLSMALVIRLAVPMPGQAAVATKRLGTGLTGTATDDGLPQAWVAPVDVAPVIDGQLDDETWSHAKPIMLGKLLERGAVHPKSQAWLVRTDETLYVGMRLAEPNIAGMQRSVSKADGPLYQDDSVELFLSPNPDRGYYQFVIGATGAVYDRKDHGDAAAFDSGAKAKVAIGKVAWSVEVAIPIASMIAGQRVPTRWRANVYRNRYAGPGVQHQAWSPTPRGDYDVPERFGHLLFTPTSPWAEQESTAQEQRGIEMEDLERGGAVLRFDFSDLPKGTRVHRARLFCERGPVDLASPSPPAAIEIYPIVAPHKKGVLPKTPKQPLSLATPWYRSFDMTQVVSEWVGGGPNHGVYVKTAPGWRKEKTYLDVMFEGEPKDAPPQVTGVRVQHRAGQTFITWNEVDDPVGRDQIQWGELKAILDDLDREREIRYCVYRSNKPITAANLHEAEQIAAVVPLSCWNINGRNIARPIDQFIATAKILQWHQWNPFRDASVDGSYGRQCPIDRFVIQEGQPPLPRGTGLYVHTATKSQQAYYAVVTRIDGVENTADISSQNAPPGPVKETVADPQPILQRELPKMPFFNYDQRRLHFVRWIAEPFTNKPSDYYNWSVGVPNELDQNVPLELNLHRDGYAYWRTHYRIEPGSIVVCPHDFPLKTWWYGYHEAHGTLRPWYGGVIRNYTEKRLLWFVDWAAGKWPVDRNRILATGCSGGASGSGALHLGLRYPDVFNMVIAGHGDPVYANAGEDLQRIWGRSQWSLKTEAGHSVWEDLDLVRHVRALPRTADLPFVSMTYSSRQEHADQLAEALMSGGWPVVTHTAWGGQRMVPISTTATNWSVPLDIRTNRSVLAVRAEGKAGDAVRNASMLWRSDDVVDDPNQYAVTLDQNSGSFTGAITLRRLQRFRVASEGTYAWRIEPLVDSDVDSGKSPEARDGQVTVGKDGVLAIRIVGLPNGTYRLTVSPSG